MSTIHTEGFNIHEFTIELLKLCKAHRIALPKNIRLTELSEDIDINTLMIHIVDEMNFANGTKDRCGPFLETKYVVPKVDSPLHAITKVNLPIMDSMRLSPNKHVPSDFKDLINRVRDNTPNAKIPGF